MKQKTIKVPRLLGERAWYLHRVPYSTPVVCLVCDGKREFPSPNGKAICKCPTCKGAGVVGENHFDVHWTTPIELTWLCHTESKGQKETRVAWSEAFPEKWYPAYGRNRLDGLRIFPTEAAAIKYALKSKMKFALRLDSKRPKWAKMTKEVERLKAKAWQESDEGKGLLVYHR